MTIARLDGPQYTATEEQVWVAEYPRVAATQCPDRVALHFADGNRSLTYSELDRQSDAFANWCQEQGFTSGDRIAYLGQNSDIYLPVLFGTIRAGLILVPLNWRLSAEELRYQLADADVRTVITDSFSKPLAEKAIAALKSAPPLLLTEGASENLRDICDRDARPVPCPRKPEQIVLMLYTSGTTGHPKGVLVSHYALSFMRWSDTQIPGLAMLNEGETILSAMPNFHIGGMSWLLMGLNRRQTVILSADPSPKNLLHLIQAHGARHSFIVPTVLRGIIDCLKESGAQAPRLESLHYGAMPIGAALLKDAMELMPDCVFAQYFGMTEVTGSATFLSPEDHLINQHEKIASVGKPYPGVSVEVRDKHQITLPPNTPGEIWVRSPAVMSGYWQLPDKSAESVRDGWYATGDGGYIDDDGYLFLTDRIKDMIISGGENVYPAEVEDVIRQHPAVLDAAVIGKADAYWGEVVAAVVEAMPQQPVDIAELSDFVKANIAAYKVPRMFYVVPELPRTASGKVKRAQLRQQHANDKE